MIQLLYIGIGGFIGSASRYLLSTYVQNNLTGLSQFPAGTFIVNVFGCFLIGIIAGLIEYKEMFNPNIRFFLLAGVLGGFTTFSTFAFESLSLINFSNLLYLLVNVFGQVLLGISAVWLGLNLVRLI